MDKGISQSLLMSNKYIVRFAQNSDEIKEAQKLRFEVFNLELGEGLASSFNSQLDVDAYDEQCDHLLVYDRNTHSVIGTYRMQTYDTAIQANGFYTADEFDLTAFPESILEKSVEVGRACIEKNHRNGRVLYLLWRGLAEYMKQSEARYLFGCCSITSQNSTEAWEVMDYLKNKGYTHPEICLPTTEAFRCINEVIDDQAWLSVELPKLFRLYIDLGAKVCSPPAIDRDFKTIDYLILLDVEKLDERSRLLFFK